ncbi:response regulator transcription factor [Alteromonas sp. LMIT006]|jgi:two-component system response regulator PhoP|uniref:response regulator transcription factor n=1 Tax=Alteromonadaceae TaxID=72275 RepID=UPI0020CA6E89|nr:response regulator transcription factor [Alteromonas sp. LMIT006]UTP72278.1 response regulator transcription factor [Alteromonas sp. LMIT006]
MRLLIVEDTPQLLVQLDMFFQKNGFSVDLADDGERALFLLKEYEYDAAIIDLGLPKLDGLEVIKAARKLDIKVPVLILTARDSWQQKVNGLDAGGDDYLTKPFHEEELLARVKALIRRSSGHASSELKAGPITLDLSLQQVYVSEQPLELTAYEYKVLEYLMLHPKKVISKSELTEHIYDQDFDLDSNVIEVFVGRLRKKLDPDNSIKPIETLRGRGYRLFSPA